VPDHSDAFGVEPPPPDHPSDSVLAAFLDGELAVDERPGVEAHLEQCASCRRALAETVEVLDASKASASPEPALPNARRRSRLPLAIMGMALAASIAAVAVMRRAPTLPVEVEDRTRDAAPRALDERIPQLAVIAPANGAERVGEHPAFVWSSTDADRYSFKLLTEDGTSLWSNETGDTTLVLPPNVRLERGRSYFWRVDAMAAGIVASTRAQRFTVSP